MVVLCNKPKFAAQSRNPAARKGYAYERKVEKTLRSFADELGWSIWTQQWFLWNGQYACPDVVLISPANCVIVCEIKLTWCDTSAQRYKYECLLQELGYSTMSVTICRNLTPATNKALVVANLHDMFSDSVVHLWL